MSKKEWMDMRVDGFLGFIHKLVMFVTLPMRKFWYIIGIILAICVVIVVLPLFYGSSVSGIVDWYKQAWQSSEIIKVKQHVKKLKLKTEEVISETKENISNKIDDAAPVKIKKEEEPVRFVAWNVAKFNRVKYKQDNALSSKNVEIKAPTFATIKAEAQEEKQQKISKEKQEMADKYRDKYYEGNLSDYYTARSDLGLEYLAKSEKLYAKADVVGPNSLYIDGTFVFLYGIYSNPNVYDNEAAWRYLEDVTKDQMVHCDIVAYSLQTQAATALCFVNGLFINKAMVENNLAKNVALK